VRSFRISLYIFLPFLSLVNNQAHLTIVLHSLLLQASRSSSVWRESFFRKKVMENQNPNIRSKKLSFILILTLISVLYFISMKMGLVSFFMEMMEKGGLSLVGRAISTWAIQMGCSNGVALTIGHLFRALLTGDAASPFNMMAPSGAAEGAAETESGQMLMASSGSSGEASVNQGPGSDAGPSGSRNWESFDLEVLEESFSSTQPGNPPVPPANVSSPEGAASPRPVVPYPYQPDEVIGGDSLLSVERRILAKNSSPSYEDIQWAQIKAQDLFEVKVEIFKAMSGLDPEGDWLGRGARALENPRTATGEESLEKLHTILSDLESKGVKSEAFSQLKGRVPLRRSGDEHSTT
jgi:hypothetical protein